MIKYLEIPKKCPYCNTDLIIKQDNNSKFLFCPNEQCGSRLINIIDHMCGKKGLDIKGLSKATIEKLINWDWIKNKKDIFELKRYKEEWIKKPGFGEKSVNNILESIEKSKNTTLDKVIAATGIPEIGISVSKDLAKNYKSWNDFRSEMDYSRIEGIGEIMNNNLLSFDYTEMDKIVEQYLIFEKNNAIINTENENNKLKNLIIVITGKLNNGNRETLKQRIESLGGKVTGSISSKTSLLINNDIESNSIKNQKAKELGIQIITEEDFYKKYLQ